MTLYDRLYAYIVECIELDRAFMVHEAARSLRCGNNLLRSTLANLVRMRRIEVASFNTHLGRRHQIRLSDGRQTKLRMPTNGQIIAMTNEDRSRQVEARRYVAEQEREEHIAFWLERERAPRRIDRPVEHFFMDKATQLALQGISA